MTRYSLLLGSTLLGVAVPTAARAEQAPPSATDLASEVARLRAEVEALKAELRAMRPQQAAATPAPAPASQATAAQPAAAAPVQTAAAAAPVKTAEATEIKWKGAPEFSTKSGWSFKPRGRLQYDIGYLRGPETRRSGPGDGRGVSTELRRAFIGMQGTLPGGFSYRADIDLANSSVEWVDLFVSWEKGPFGVTVGQHHNFQSLERLTSDLFLSFTERAAFNDAYNFERRVGVSGQYKTGRVLANLGVFTDDIAALGDDRNKSLSVDGRFVWMPRWGNTQFHLGGSGHWRRLGALVGTNDTRYRQRPYLHSTDIRYLDTRLVPVRREIIYGGEFAMIRGPLSIAGEASWLHVIQPGGTKGTFSGGYAEIGYFLTPGDSRTYKAGVWDRVVPKDPVDKGGIGAIQVNLRYDRLDLIGGPTLRGGQQDAYGVSLVWIPTAYLRFIANYFHLVYDQAAEGPSHFTADSMAVRAQLDF